MSRLLQPTPIERDRFVSHVQSVSQADVRSSREVKQANRAVVIATFPGHREHGVQGRVLPMGGLAPGWRVIKVPTLASRASFTRSPISAIVAAAIRALTLTSCGFYGRECSVGEKTGIENGCFRFRRRHSVTGLVSARYLRIFHACSQSL